MDRLTRCVDGTLVCIDAAVVDVDIDIIIITMPTSLSSPWPLSSLLTSSDDVRHHQYADSAINFKNVISV